MVNEKVEAKIWGMERSGTNYLASLLGSNVEGLEVSISEGGWKHGIVSRTQYGHLTADVNIIITKHPKSWVASFKDYYGDDFTTLGALRMYAVTLECWMQTFSGRDDAALLIHYEDLIKDPELEVRLTVSEIDDAYMVDDFNNVNGNCTFSNGEDTVTRGTFNPEKYTGGGWRENLPNDWDYAINRIDKWGLLEPFTTIGYDPHVYGCCNVGQDKPQLEDIEK